SLHQDASNPTDPTGMTGSLGDPMNRMQLQPAYYALGPGLKNQLLLPTATPVSINKVRDWPLDVIVCVLADSFYVLRSGGYIRMSELIGFLTGHEIHLLSDDQYDNRLRNAKVLRKTLSEREEAARR